MDKFRLENATTNDLDDMVLIYNSNPVFLRNHLGVETITSDFIRNEIEQMIEIGFESLLIIDDKNEKIGFCDIKIGEETYLSLLMLDKKTHGMGYGKEILQQIERMLIERNAQRVRIDVVNDYKDNVVSFWIKHGYMEMETIKLEWNGYHSTAVKMYKFL